MYATSYLTTDEAEALGAQGADQAMLDRASRLVRRCIRGTGYALDTAGKGFPADADLLQAVQAATLIQVRAWLDNGITNPGVLPAGSGVVQAKSAGGASVTYAPDAAAAQTRSALQGGDWLVPDALAELEEAGLITTAVRAARLGYITQGYL